MNLNKKLAIELSNDGCITLSDIEGNTVQLYLRDVMILMIGRNRIKLFTTAVKFSFGPLTDLPAGQIDELQRLWRRCRRQ